MAEKYCLSEKFLLTNFINLYRSHPCLWKVKSKEYNNRSMKNAAYATLVEQYKRIDARADKAAVIKRINSLRSGFRREKNKLLADRNYTPKIWYFELLKFTDTNEKIVNLNVDEEVREEWSQTEEDEQENWGIEDNEDIKLEDVELVTPSASSIEEFQSGGSRSNFEHFGLNLVDNLKEMSKGQAIIAQRIISDVIFYGQLGRLSVNNAQAISKMFIDDDNK